MEFLSSLLSTWSVISALLLVASVKTRREHRARQFLMPAVAVVYAIAALYLLYRFNEDLRETLSGLPVSGRLGPTGLYLLENTVVLLGFVIVKGIFLPILRAIFRDGTGLSASLTERIYQLDPERRLWFVEPRLSGMRDLYRVLYWVSMVLTSLLIAFAITFAHWPAFAAIAFPAIATMVIGEFYFAIDGLTEEEYESDIHGESDSARKIANFGPLRTVLRDTFPDRVLSDSLRVSSRAALDSGKRLGDMSRADSTEQRIAGQYFRRLRQERQDVDVNLADAATALMEGTSVLFMNPFYGDLTPYLSLPVYNELLHGRRCLIITGRDTIVDDLAQWITDGVASISGVPDLWRVKTLDDIGRDSVDIGLLRFADLYNQELLQANDVFLADVGLVILAEPSRMVASGQVGLPLVLSRCGGGRTPTFAAFDGNSDGLVDALSHLLKTSLSEVVASSLPAGLAFDVLWAAEGDNMHSTVLPGVGRYLGVGTEIAAVALKYQVSHVTWVGGETFPVTDMRWVAGQYYQQINAFADIELSQDALRDALSVSANPWGVRQLPNQFLVVEDENRNVYETLRRYSTRATQAGFFNVISEDYLLRDYMVDNEELFAYDPKAVPSITPDFARTERNGVLRMVHGLGAFGMTEAELSREFDLLGWRVPESAHVTGDSNANEARVVTALRRAIAAHTSVRNPNTIPFSVQFDPSRPGSRADRTVYRILPGSDVDRVVADLRPAYFYVEDEREAANFVGSLLYGQVYQSLLPGQFVTHGGKYYEVQSIDPPDSQGGVVLRRAADHIRDRRTYRQLRNYVLSDVVSVEGVAATVRVGGTEISRCLANVTVSTAGYVEGSSRSRMGSARRIDMAGIPDREYSRKALLRVRLPGVTPHVRKTLTLMLNEMFTSLFPREHQYVAALTSDPERQFDGLLSTVIVDDDGDAIYIVEDSMMDMGLMTSVERNWDRIMEVIADYLAWNLSPPRVQPRPEPVPSSFEFPETAQVVVRLPWWRRLIHRILRRPTEPASALPPASAPASGPASAAEAGDEVWVEGESTSSAAENPPDPSADELGDSVEEEANELGEDSLFEQSDDPDLVEVEDNSGTEEPPPEPELPPVDGRPQ